ncbi:hypothetical protein DGN07_12845 [Xanthomonas citri pv. fuscans]|nr:hypothetical protein DGN07_12845 [Xanthomonas citri pv. fuscans]
MSIPDLPESLTGASIVRARHEQSATPIRILFIEDLSKLIGKTPTSIRTFATNQWACPRFCVTGPQAGDCHLTRRHHEPTHT